MTTTEKYQLTSTATAEIDQWLAKFPQEQRQSAVLQALRIVQDEEGWLSNPMMDAIADYIGMPNIAVYEVATFYSMYDLKPVGKHKLCVCTNVSCMLNGSADIAQHLKNKLGIGFGESTKDGKYHLQEVECLAACCNAPAMQVNKDYHENLTPEKVDDILANLE